MILSDETGTRMGASYDNGVTAATPDRETLVCPASFAQRRLWFLQEMAPESAAYNMSSARRVLGPLDLASFEMACNALVARHESLRTTFAVEAGEPVQVLHPAVGRFGVTLTSLTTVATDIRESRLVECIARESDTPFELARGPLLRVHVFAVGPEEHVILVVLHHVVSDGWSLSVLFRELDALYRAAVATGEGADPAILAAAAGLDPLPIQYADYAVWQQEWLTGAELARQEEYWLGRLALPLHQLELPTDLPRPAVRRGRGASHTFALSADLTTALHALSKSEGATPFMTLLAAYDVLLYRYTGQDDLVVGTPIAGRTRVETEGLIGCFINTLALRADLSGTPTFREVLARVRADTLDAYAHQDLPFERLVELLHPGRDRSHMPLFETMFVLQNAREAAGTGAAGPVTFCGLPARGVGVPVVTSKFDLQLTVAEQGGVLTGSFAYDTDLFEAATIARMARHFERLLRSIAEHPEASISELDLLDDHERETVVSRWNETAASYPSDATLLSLLEEQLRATPDATAIVSGARTMTYAELHAQSDVVATHLAALGVGRNSLVGVCIERSLDLMAALFGVVKAGAAYVPLDAEYPPDRLAFMVEDAALSVILTQSHLVDRIPLREGTQLVAVDALRRIDSRSSAPIACPEPDDLAYMIYTSGSTGQPKGALNTHRGIVNRLLWMHGTYALTAADVVLQKTPISFDVSVWELFWPLLTGATLVIAEPGGHRDPDYLVRTIRQRGVNVLHFVPSMLRLFLQHPEAGRCTTLRDVMCSGEALPLELTERFFATLPHTRLHNLYGPTEAAVDVSFWPCGAHEPRGVVPIGRPVANTQLYVLDERQHVVPIGVEGELYIGGVQVGAGYHGRPALTAERFLPDPFRPGVPGARLYRTGDRARWRSDGVLEYLGRRDGQIKLRGFRIELGEIETALRRVPGVLDAVVALQQSGASEPALVAYYVAAPGVTEVPRVPATTMRARLRETLPEFMIPSAFVAIDEVPRSPSGKVDRRALPAPHDLADAARAYAPPRTTLEHELVHIWEELLPKRPIGIHDDFFEIGGHSLLAARMLFEIERVRSQRLPLASLFEAATIDKIAAQLEGAVQRTDEPDAIVLNSEGTQPPLAFLHGDVRGGGWYCRRLATLLGAETPLIVLPTLRGDNAHGARTVEEMAAAQIRALRGVQPVGPYRLGGFCAGGLVAFEMARQLTADGETVERLILLDSTGVNSRFIALDPLLRTLVRAGDEDERLARRAELLRRLRYYTARFRQVRRMSRRAQLRWARVNALRLAGRAAITSGRAKAPLMSAPTEPEVTSLEFVARPATQTLRFQERAAAAYIPRSYGGVVDVIWAADQFPRNAADHTRGWSRVAPGVRVHSVSSPHVGLITYNLPVLAERIRACLDDPPGEG